MPDRELGEILIDSSPDTLIAVAPDGTILFWNTGAKAVYGYIKPEAVGNRLNERIVPPDLVQDQKTMRNAIEAGLTIPDGSPERKMVRSSLLISPPRRSVTNITGSDSLLLISWTSLSLTF